MQKVSERTTYLVRLPLLDATLLHPEQCILSFVGVGTLDIGALCFLRRTKTGRRKDGRNLGVDTSSLSKHRTHKIRELIVQLSDEQNNGAAKPATLWARLANFMRFLDWADAHYSIDVLLDLDAAKSSFRAYVEHLRELVRQNRIKLNSATTFQAAVKRVLGDLLQIHGLAEGVRLLRSDMQAREVTSPPHESQQSKILGLASAFFNGFFDLAVENSPFPFRLKMPEYLGWQPSFLWVFPTIIRFVTPSEKEEGSMEGEGAAFDYTNGALRTPEQWKTVANPNHSARANSEVKAATLTLNLANTNPQHYQRRRAAMAAHNAFALLFIAHTGMNWSQVKNLQWTKDFDVGAESQGFRAIKYRAGGRIVSFRIETIFLPVFRKFLLLRDYLLNGEEFHYLFLTYGVDLSGTPSIIGNGVLRSTQRMFRRIDPTISPVTSREWRAAKADWLLRKTDASTTALLLQNSEEVVLKHYAAGSESQASEEMTEFFANLESVIRPQSDNTLEQSAVGNCLDRGHPITVNKGASIQPDCHQPEGCLFCDKYAIHADDVDTRKLISCRFCITETEHLSNSVEQFNHLFGGVIARIDALLTHISNRSSDYEALVSRVSHEVNAQGMLDHYWSRKMEMLVSLGVIE